MAAPTPPSPFLLPTPFGSPRSVCPRSQFHPCSFLLLHPSSTRERGDKQVRRNGGRGRERDLNREGQIGKKEEGRRNPLSLLLLRSEKELFFLLPFFLFLPSKRSYLSGLAPIQPVSHSHYLSNLFPSSPFHSNKVLLIP